MEKLNEGMRKLGFEPADLPRDEWAQIFLRREHYEPQQGNLAHGHEGNSAMLVYRVEDREHLKPEKIEDTLIEMHKKIRDYLERNKHPKRPFLFAFRNEEFKLTTPRTKDWDPHYIAVFYNLRASRHD